jgi:heat shock protein HslJ
MAFPGRSRRSALWGAACSTLLAACSLGSPGGSGSPAEAGFLEGTTWQLVEFQSSDDRIGTLRPSAPERYTMTLEPGGRASLRLDCNRGSASWSAVPGAGDSGSFSMGPVAMTRVACPPPSMDVHVARDAEYVRTYVLRGGRLYLNLMADGGTWVWEALEP